MTGGERGEAAPVSLMIALPTMGQVATGTALSLISLTQELRARGLGFTVSTYRFSDIVISRNHLMSVFLDDARFSHVLWIDADMVFAPETFWRLLAFGEDFTAAAYAQKSFDWNEIRRAVAADEGATAMADLVARSYTYNHQIGGCGGATWTPERRDGFITVPAVGMGFALMTRAVPEGLVAQGVAREFTTMSEMPGYGKVPWFDFFSHLSSDDGGLLYAEDQSLCCRWVEGCGGAIWLDCDADVGHLGTHEYRGRYSGRADRDFP